MFPYNEILWQVPEDVSNSAGNLALYICSNQQHFVGHVLGGTDFKRDREAEFNTRGGSRGEITAKLRETANVVAQVLSKRDEAVLALPYPQPPADLSLSIQRFLLHLSAHLTSHLGQAGSLRRILTHQNITAGEVSLHTIADLNNLTSI